MNVQICKVFIRLWDGIWSGKVTAESCTHGELFRERASHLGKYKGESINIVSES